MIGYILFGVGCMALFVATGLISFEKRIFPMMSKKLNGKKEWDGIDRRCDPVWQSFQEYAKRTREHEEKRIGIQ